MAAMDFREGLALRINERLFYGWVMLAVAAVGLFASGPAQSHIFSVFITPISRDLGISQTAVSTAYALATLVAAFGLPYVGRLIDRFGVRRVALTVAVLFGASAMAFGFVDNVVALALAFAALRFLGQGALMLNCANLVSQWFSRKRGFALSLMALGFSASMAAHPPLAAWLTEQVGWREAWLWLGLMTWLLLIPLIFLLVQSKPEDLGLEPDGTAEAAPAGGWAGAAPAHAATVGLSLQQALRTPAFWIIALSLATLSMLVTALFFFQVSAFETRGLSRQLAAQIFSVSALTMVLAMPLLGRALDRFPTKPVFAGAVLTMSASMLALIFVQDLATAIVYGIVFGISNAAIHTHYAYLWPRFFGRRHLGSIQGTGQTITVVGASIGPLPFGISYDLLGSYTGALVLLSALPVLCAVAILFMQPPQLDQERSGEAG